MDAKQRLLGLEVRIDDWSLERLETEVSSGFLRVTTVVRLRGGGVEGVGEDVTYEEKDHVRWLRAAGRPPVEGRCSLRALSERLVSVELFPRPPQLPASRDYRRWAVESAALDLALRQAGSSFAAAVEREPRPLRFVVSLRLGDPPSAAPVRRWLDIDPDLRFKLDPTSAWTPELIAELAATGAVDALDFKGHYRGTIVDQQPDADLVRRVAEAFPDAWLEDPAADPEVEAVLADHRDRVAWDAPIHAVADIERLPHLPGAINVKPSRFGSVAALLDAYAWCRRHGVPVYGGGQFELGPGRGQIQLLASLFHPDAPNDVAPGGYNAPEPRPGLPSSPLDPAPTRSGFRWSAGDAA